MHACLYKFICNHAQAESGNNACIHYMPFIMFILMPNLQQDWVVLWNGFRAWGCISKATACPREPFAHLCPQIQAEIIWFNVCLPSAVSISESCFPCVSPEQDHSQVEENATTLSNRRSLFSVIFPVSVYMSSVSTNGFWHLSCSRSIYSQGPSMSFCSPSHPFPHPFPPLFHVSYSSI